MMVNENKLGGYYVQGYGQDQMLAASVFHNENRGSAAAQCGKAQPFRIRSVSFPEAEPQGVIGR